MLKETRSKLLNQPLRIKAFHACKTYPLVYLKMPKSACTTICNVMYYLDNGEYLESELNVHYDRFTLINGAREPNSLLRILIRKHYAFTFIRSPEQRAFSCYMDKIHTARRSSFGKVRQYLVNNYGLKLDGDGGGDARLLQENFLNFLKFLGDNIAGKTGIRRNAHWWPQSRIIRRHKDVPLHFIGLVEKLPVHLSHVFKQAGMSESLAQIPKLNRSSDEKVGVEAIITPDIKKLIGEIYAADFRLYERVRKRTERLEAKS